MTSHPVSVIIPTYNRKSFLQRAVNSVLRQTSPCKEVLVVDDGSTDTTEEYVSDMAEKTCISIRYIKQQNSGPAAARNTGIRCARFPYLAFLDSDDHWHKRKLERQFTRLANAPSYLISHTRERWLRRGEHLNQKKIHIPRNGDIFTHCLQLCAVGMSTVLVKRKLFDVVGVFDETLRCCEDYDFWLRVSCRYPFLLVDEPLTTKEGGREDQVSSIYRVGMDRLRIVSLRKLIASGHLTATQQRSAARELHRKATIYGNGCVRHGKDAEGRHYLKLAEQVAEAILEGKK